MPEINDAQLVRKLIRATRHGKIAWDQTGIPDTFAASYGGKWTLTIQKVSDTDAGTNWYLTITNAQGDEVLRIWDERDNEIDALFEQARRYALKVDEALSDLLKEIGEEAEPDSKGTEVTGPEISDEDIPF